jgi:arabinose-5-phosphate isomerase
MKPQVTPDANIKDVIIEISAKMLGVTAVVENTTIVGIITDGDLRRMLQDDADFSKLTAKDIMGAHPKSINKDAMAVDAMELLEAKGISQLLVEDQGKYAGVVHIHNLIKEGII